MHNVHGTCFENRARHEVELNTSRKAAVMEITSNKSYRILVVDDDEAIRQGYSQLNENHDEWYGSQVCVFAWANMDCKLRYPKPLGLEKYRDVYNSLRHSVGMICLSISAWNRRKSGNGSWAGVPRVMNISSI